MAQLNPGDWSIAPATTDGPTLADKLNRVVAAACSSWRGTNRPVHATTGMLWVKAGAGANGEDVVMFFNGTTDVPLIEVDSAGGHNLVNTYSSAEIDALLLSVTNQLGAIVTIPVGGIILWSGNINSIPPNFRLCDGTNGTPNLMDRFVVGAGNGYQPGQTGGFATITLNATQIPSHAHWVDPPNVVTDAQGSHAHTVNFGFDPSTSNTGSGSSVREPGQGSLNVATAAAGNHQHNVNIPGFNSGAAGGNQPHENRPPYIAVAYIMRVS